MFKKTRYSSRNGDLTVDLQVFRRESCREFINQISKSEFLLYSPLLGSGFCPDNIVVSADHPLSLEPFYVVEDQELGMKLHAALLSVVKHLCDSGVAEGDVYSVKVNIPTLKQLDEDSIEGYVASKMEGN